MSIAIDLFDLFGPGLLARPGKSSTVTLLRGRAIGAVRVESGLVAVADPHRLGDVPPLGRRCPVGTFVVLIGEAEQDGGGDTAGLCLRFRDVRPSSWETVGAVSVGSASVAIADAAHADVVSELATRDGAMPLPECHEVFRSNGADVGAGCRTDDGAYPVRWGLDDHGEPVCLCVEIERPERYTRWTPPDGCPAPPDAFTVETCVRWIRALPGYDGNPAGPGRVTPAQLVALERFAGRPAPAALRELYRRCAPWTGKRQAAWQDVATAAGFAKGRGAFPLYLGWGFADALVPGRGDDMVRSIDEHGASRLWQDIPAWLVLQAITLFNL
jgi:hypothetical protein